MTNSGDHDTHDGTCVRDYVHVEDLSGAAEALMEDEQPRAVAFNLSSGKGHSVLEVIESCRMVTGIPIHYRGGPRRSGDPSEMVAGSNTVREALGWRPRYQDLDSILATAWRGFSSCISRSTCTSSG